MGLSGEGIEVKRAYWRLMEVNVVAEFVEVDKHGSNFGLSVAEHRFMKRRSAQPIINP